MDDASASSSWAVPLQRYAHDAAAASYRAVACPPFTVFVSSGDPSPHRNYASMPGPVVADVAAIERVTQTFRALDRRPRFELIHAANPELGAVLEACGYALEERNWLMLHTACAAGERRPSPELEVIVVDARSAARDIADAQRVQACAFGEADVLSPARTIGLAQRAALGPSRLLLGRRSGEPVCAAGLMPVRHGIAEITGVATVPWQRGRGFGTAITAHALQLARRDAPRVFLTAASDEAGRIYARLGFVGMGDACAYTCIDDPA